MGSGELAERLCSEPFFAGGGRCMYTVFTDRFANYNCVIIRLMESGQKLDTNFRKMEMKGIFK